MGANATQGVAVFLFLVAFTFLALANYSGGSMLYVLLFLVGLAGSIAMFLKAKPMEHMEK